VGLQVLLLGWAAWTAAGCGGSAPAAEAPAPEPSAVPAPTPAEPVTDGNAKAEAAPDAGADKPGDAAAPAEAPPPAKDPNAQREVKYTVTPEGLKIEVAGVRFMASAEAKQIGQGWGTKVSLKAEATDGKAHTFLSPKNGPIAFAAAVFKKGSTEAERVP